MYVNVDIDVDEVLSEIDTEDLISELKSRGSEYNTYGVATHCQRGLLEMIYQNRRLGKDYQAELDKLIYGVLGKVI
jgi:hypothetical protein